MRRTCLPTLVGTFLLCLGSPYVRADSFVTFESGHVRPLALAQDGEILLAVNTPDNRLELFRATPGGLAHEAEVRVGLEPVAVVADDRGRAYVVNHLSDSVSVVNFTEPTRPFVEQTLLVGDEPRDVVIAGVAHDRVFITTAHRGQNDSRDPQITTPGIGRADVWVFDRGSEAPRQIVTLFCDTPRALAASLDGTRVYAAAFHSGNQSTVLNEDVVSTNLGSNAVLGDGFRGLGVPEPTQSDVGVEGPQVGVIVKKDGGTGEWRDSAGRDWSPRVRLDLPDLDVFAMDVTGDSVGEKQIQSVSGVGTIIFNLAVHPVTGDVYASNLESLNDVRFEPVLRGHFVENRVTIVKGLGLGAAQAHPIDLNSHIDRDLPFSSTEDIAQSLALPLDMVFTSDGETLFVAAMGSAKVGVLDSAGSVLDRIDVGGGPSGLALDESRSRLYVMNRFDHAIAVVNTKSRTRTATVPLRYNPEPQHVQVGRLVLYDSTASAHGDASCASCHIFGDFDSLAWNLGDPGGAVEPNPVVRVATQGRAPLGAFHPMKGPMTTQSLRGMEGAGPMHWRGDRNGVNAGAPAADPFDEGQAFLHFRPAFQGLLGKETELEPTAMERFRDFILSVSYPPNPIAPIDGTLTEPQAAGREIFLSSGSRSSLGGDGDPCGSCHTLPLGTDGHGSFELETQDFKVAHLRNLYQKVGMFGYALPDVVRAPAVLAPRPTPHLGDQVRGFGFLHDGSVPTLENFFRVPFLSGGIVFAPFTFPDESGRSGLQKTAELNAFMMAFDTGLAPVVGHQLTLTTANLEAGFGRYTTLRARAEDGDCDLVLVLAQGDERRGFVYDRKRSFRSDRAGAIWSEDAFLAALDDGGVLTVTAVPPGSGTRIGVDRDADGHLDRDEIEAGTDPADANSRPPANRFLRGDCTGDGGMDIADPITALLVLFSDLGPPVCVDACDADSDGNHHLTDAVFVLNFLFREGPAPGGLPFCESGENCSLDTCPQTE